METSTTQRTSMKKKHQLDNLKSSQFYDTFVTRNDVKRLCQLELESQQKEYIITVITRFEIGHQNGKGFPFEAYQLISFEYHQAQTISKATEESQTLCKHNIFSEYLLTMYKGLKELTLEQISGFMSLGFYIFVESLERKITQIDSYEIFKRLLRPQILLTNTYNKPLYTQELIIQFNTFMTNYFYRYYSLYELRMTTYQEVNIFGRLKGEAPMAQEVEQQDGDSIQEEDEFNFKDVEFQQEEEVEDQQIQKIEEKDEQYIEQQLSSFKLNYNNRLESGQLLLEAERILNKKK